MWYNVMCDWPCSFCFDEYFLVQEEASRHTWNKNSVGIAYLASASDSEFNSCPIFFL